MGQITNPIVKGITVLPVDRQTGPAAGAGNTGNNTIFLGNSAGLNNASANVIGIGNHAFSGSNTGNPGSIVLGVNAADSAKVASSSTAALSLIVIGFNAFTGADHSGSMVVIGENCLAGFNTAVGGSVCQNSVFIGSNILPLTCSAGLNTQIVGNVFIGDSILLNDNAWHNPIQANVIIGYNMFAASTGTSSFTNNIIIAPQGVTNLGNAAGAFAGNVILGEAALPGMNSGANGVYIGEGVGANLTGSCNNNLFLGSGAGAGFGANVNNILAIGQTAVGDIIQGNFNSGNLILGLVPSNVTDVNLAGAASIVHLINGAKGSVPPVNGGYFVCLAGELHWIDTTGAETVLTPGSANGRLADVTGTAFTNNAAAAAGTLLNAPVAGNPTKWIPINDNGTIRNIPAW